MEQSNEKQNEKSTKISRRNFIKGTGFAGLAAGVAAVSVSYPGQALVGEPTDRPNVD